MTIKDTLLKVLSDTTAPKERRELAEKILAWIVREVPRLRDRLAEGLKSEAEGLTEFRASGLWESPAHCYIDPKTDSYISGNIAHTVAKPPAPTRPHAVVEDNRTLAEEFE
jgi:thymidylate synthase ThyX